jgi:hypothetical protein
METTMIQNRIDQEASVRVQSQDPIGVIAGKSTTANDGHPHRDVAPEGSFEIAWALAH